MISFIKKNKFYLTAAGFTYLLMFIYFQFLLPRVKIYLSVIPVTYYDIASAGGSDVWICGDYGIILHSKNKGKTWKYQENPFFLKKTVTSINFIDSKRGWAVADNTLMETLDGGKTWKIIFREEQYHFDRVYPFNENEILIPCGSDNYYRNNVLISEDHFKTFRVLINSNNSTTHYSRINKIGKNHYWIIDQDNIHETKDDGKNWETKNIFPDKRYDSIKTMCFNNNGNILFLYNDMIYRSTDMGNNWSRISEIEDDYYYSKFRLNGSNGTIIGDKFYNTPESVIRETSDGGKSWNKVEEYSEITNLNDVVFLNDKRGIICGDNGSILETGDGGKSWKIQKLEWMPFEIKKMLYEKRTE